MKPQITAYQIRNNIRKKRCSSEMFCSPTDLVELQARIFWFKQACDF